MDHPRQVVGSRVAATKRPIGADPKRRAVRYWRIRRFVLHQLLDRRIDPTNRQGIKTLGPQLPAALNFQHPGIATPCQKLPVALNIDFELQALFAHGAPLKAGGSKRALCHRWVPGWGDDGPDNITYVGYRTLQFRQH